MTQSQPAATMREMADRIAHLEAQLRHHGITPMSEFICACGIRKNPPRVVPWELRAIMGEMFARSVISAPATIRRKIMVRASWLLSFGRLGFRLYCYFNYISLKATDKDREDAKRLFGPGGPLEHSREAE